MKQMPMASPSPELVRHAKIDVLLTKLAIFLLFPLFCSTNFSVPDGIGLVKRFYCFPTGSNLL